MIRSFESVHPELANQWSEKNLPLRPCDVTYGSKKEYWWKGPCGHEWLTSPKARSSGENCPICANKRIVKGINDLASLYPELMEEWSNRNTIDPETISAASHKKAWWKDPLGHEWETEIRYRTLRKTGCPYCKGHKLLKGFNDLESAYPSVAKEWSSRNFDILPDMVTAFSNQKVVWKCAKCGGEWQARIADRTSGSGCPYCAGQVILTGFNDLATLYPGIAKEWSEKNVGNADSISPKSTENVWWKCSECGNEWRGVISSRVKGSMCPVCAERAVKEGFNDLLTTDPEIVHEWNFSKNQISPRTVSRTSHKLVWWNCRYGHTYSMGIYNRVIEKNDCKYCMIDFWKLLPKLAVIYYARVAGVSVKIDSDKEIGLPFDAYIPSFRTAIDFPNGNRADATQTESWKMLMCQKRDISYMIIHMGQNKDPIKVIKSVRNVFQMNNIFLDTDLQKDLNAINKAFDKLRDKSYAEAGEYYA